MEKVIAVIPAHNEEKYIEKVVKDTKKYVDEVIVIDDASKDNTRTLAKKAGAIVLRHEINLHKGASLKTGCEAAIRLGAEVVVLLDGDGQHDPAEIPKMLNQLKKCDLVIGARKFNKKMPLKSKIGNKVLTYISKICFKNNVTDTQSGFRAFRTSIYPQIKWESSGYGVESEVLSKIDKNNLSVGEIRIKTIYNDKYKGTTPFDGMKIALNTLKWRFS